MKINISKKSSNKDKELKDFTASEKVAEENELTSTTTTAMNPSASNVTIADTVDLNSDTDNRVLSETIVIDETSNQQQSSLPNQDDFLDHDINADILEENKKSGNDTKKEHTGKKSKASASLKFQTVWFNFAAPPKTPISKKIDFTKLDWNLLSTGSPGIEAWLNPVNRLQNAVSGVVNCYNSRVGAIMASVMTEALEAQELHFAKASSYDNLTALAKTLKEDHSCQLCCVLLRYIKKKGLDEIESNLDFKIIPPLIHLRQGRVG